MTPEERSEWEGFIEDDGFAHECDHPLCGRGWICYSCQEVQMILGVRKRGDWKERPEMAFDPVRAAVAEERGPLAWLEERRVELVERRARVAWGDALDGRIAEVDLVIARLAGEEE